MALGEPSMAFTSKGGLPPTVSEGTEPEPVGTVESTLTPGAAISTSLLNWEKVAHALFSSMAACSDLSVTGESPYLRKSRSALEYIQTAMQSSLY